MHNRQNPAGFIQDTQTCSYFSLPQVYCRHKRVVPTKARAQ